MKEYIKIALAQMNPTIGDIVGNTKEIISFLKEAKEKKALVVAFPEMAIMGYPAQDLLFQEKLIYSNMRALSRIRPYTKDFAAVIIGYCHSISYKKNESTKQKSTKADKTKKQGLHNSYAVFSYGELIGRGDKVCLPNYGVFDDYRYFIPGTEAKVFVVNYEKTKKLKLGIAICEDIWYQNDDDDHPIYPFRPTQELVKKNADLVIVINASPFEIDKHKHKTKLIQKQASTNALPIFYVNMYGGNDKIIFDGNSFAVDKHGNIITKGKSFARDLVIYDLDIKSKLGKPISLEESNKTDEENIFSALVLGKKDYHKKCSIKKSVIGVSGGIDSALVLAIDVSAIGKENVLGIISPSRYTSNETLADAITLCKNFGVEYRIIPLEELDNKEWRGVLPEKYKRYKKYCGETSKSIVFENMQAIDRMSILRAIANEESRLISGTGNKTELAVGYATVCGDLQADILVIGDLYKGEVYKLAQYVNNLYKKDMIPNSIIARKPSAELTENQIDPFDYTKLDFFVKLKIEQYLTDDEILEFYRQKHLPKIKFSKEEITKYSKLIDINEHKRFKSGYILKVSSIAFGEDRRINTAKKITLFHRMKTN